CSNWAQASWGTAKWIFEDALDKTPQGLAFKIQNSYTTTTSGEAIYLYESNGEVLYGPLEDSSDLSYYWFFTIDDNGNYSIRNWKTGHFIVYRNLLDHNQKMACKDYSEIDAENNEEYTFKINNIKDGGVIKHNIESAVNPAIRIHTENFEFPVCSNWAQNFFGTAQWLFIDAVSTAPTEQLTPNGHTRIKNNWSGQYLYEDNGKVKYGQPASHNPLSHWDIIEDNGSYLIRNVATGHYFSYKNQTDYNEPVECVELNQAQFAQFNITESLYNGVTVNTIVASTNPNLVLHVEQQTGYAQCSNWAQASWGSAKWVFEPASDDVVGGVKEEIPLDQDPAATLKDGDIIRLKNSWREMYLYQAEDGKVAYGNIPASDMRSQWIIEVIGQNVRLKNRATDMYMSVENGLGYAECLALNDATLFNQWEITTAPNTFSGLKTIRCAGWSDDAASGEDSYYLHTEGDKGYAEYGPIPPSWGSPQWIITRVSPDDSPTGFVRIKNRTTGNYLYEKDGKVAFEPDISIDDASSHWVIERTIRYTRIKNRATGHYISAEGIQSLVDPLVLTESANDLNSVWKIEPTGDGHFTLENMNKDGWFIHNANAITVQFAQCSKVSRLSFTSQWVFEVAPVEINRELPTDYVLIKSRSGDLYLYENKNGAVLYGNLDNQNTSYQWRIQQDGDSYTIVNKYTGHYLSFDLSKPYLYCTTNGTLDTAHWFIDPAAASNFSILANKSEPERFVNINSGLGFAQCSVSSNEKITAQWSFETPTSNAAPVYTEDDLNTSTPVISGNGYIAIKNKATGQFVSDNEGTIGFAGSASDLSCQWLLEDYNGYRRIKNRQTGNYLIISGSNIVSANNGTSLSAQWSIDDFLGYVKIKSASDGKYIYTDGSALKAKASGNGSDILWSLEPIAEDIVYQASRAFTGGGAVISGNSVTGFNKPGDRVVFTVNARNSGNYNITLSYAAKNDTQISVFVNGVKATELTLSETSGDPAQSTATIALNKGLNTISYQYMRNGASGLRIYSITVENGINTDYKGATLPYITYEAEDADTNGTVLGPSREYYTFASESSGRKAVRLQNPTDYIEFELAEDANAFVIRYVIPDAPQGGGTTQTVGLYKDGQKIQDVELSSKHSWVYGSYPWTNNPADGKPHRYYEEVRILLDNTIDAGSKIRLQKNNGAEYCVIDLIDAEYVEAPYEMPQGFLSITDFGAVPNDGLDDTAAMNNCIAAARAQGKGVWIPAGTFSFLNGSRGVQGVDDTRIVILGNVTIKGAGVWHSILEGPFAGFMVKGSNVEFYDFTIQAEEVTREDAHGVTGVESDYNTLGMKNLTVQNIWFNHTKTGLWLHNMDSAHIVGNRVRNTYADGLHLSKGTTNSVIEQNNVRYSGDDGIALWSQEYADVNNTVRFNTVELPWLANNISVYGGENNRIQDNIIRDTIAFGGGINISSNFNPMPFTGSVIVERNNLIRAGGHEYNFNVDYGAIRIDATEDIGADVIFSNNNIYDSSYQGISIHGPGTVSKLVFENNVIDGTGTWGINGVSGSKGNAVFANTIVRRAGIENEYKPGNEIVFSYPNNWKAYDSYVPQWPEDSTLTVSGISSGSVTLSWPNAVSDVELYEYVVIWDGQVRKVSKNTTTLAATGLSSNTAYEFEIYAVDIYGNRSGVLKANATTGASGGSGGGSVPNPQPSDSSSVVVHATVENNSALAKVNSDVLDGLIDNANNNGTQAIEIRVELDTNADSIALEVPVNSFRNIANIDVQFVVSTDIGSIAFDAEAISSIANKAGTENITISITKVDSSALSQELQALAGGRPVYSLTVKAGNTTISDFGGGKARIVIPYTLKPGEDVNAIVVYHIDDNGTVTVVRGAYSTSSGSVIAVTKHFSRFVVGYNKVTFSDVKENDWFNKAVTFIASRNITAGTGQGKFSPLEDTTRAQFIVMLFKAFGIEPSAPGADNFADAGNTYYTGYLARAKELGISKGTGNNMFSPNAKITRQEMFTLLYNALKIMGELPEANGPASVADFIDASQVASYAREAMDYLIKAGKINGNAGKLSPDATTTRAQIAQILYNLLSEN
ncbi:MAG: hypothetical protein GXX10_00380, partial [Clostridiaceae bacterium]|nr:hypothetical protein [Clostridiaceae bacterium]